MSISKIAAITAEFNPLHNGHLKLIERAKALSPDLLIVILNGDFTQRGSIALLDKYTRARHAILAGADLVLELPQVFGAACAERFADGAVKLLAGIPAKEKILAFGSEEGDLALLENAARILEEEPIEVSVDLKELMDMGFSYPVARARAFEAYAAAKGIKTADLTAPNNILAIEYLRSIKKRGGVTPFTVKRTGAYDATTLDPEEPSASAIRAALSTEDEAKALACLPAFVADDLAEPQKDGLSPILLFKLSQMTAKELRAIADVKEGIENRILRLARESADAESLVKAVSGKRYTEARIRRILTNATLGVSESLLKKAVAEPPYYKVLALKKERTDALSHLSKAGRLLTGEEEARQSGIDAAVIDAKAHDLYRIAKGLPDLDDGMLLV